MSVSEYFPFFDKLTPAQQQALTEAASFRSVPKGTILHNGNLDCIGLLVIRSGQLRVYITSDDGREITIYRLLEQDICLLSASCVLKSIQFDITISAEKDTDLWVISPHFYKNLMEESAVVANYTNQILSSRFTDVMWLIEQVMWKSFDKRLARFLIDEAVLEQTNNLQITHEKIASHLGTAREVVTRMLKYFQAEGMVKLTRGAIEIIDEDRLEDLTDS
jgi:CRP/FNR family transcriptional regulator